MNGKSLRRHEGYILIDNRASDGVDDKTVINAGLPIGAGRGLFEAPTYTCSHCDAVVVMNPLRNRERAYCSNCDSYICDNCGVIKAKTLECRPMARIIDEELIKAMLSQQQ